MVLLALEAKDVAVLAWVIISLTVFDVPLMFALSSAYCADRLWVRTLKLCVFHWAIPEPFRAAVPTAAMPS